MHNWNKFTLLLICSLLIAPPSFAYIPRAHLILEKAAASHGLGTYQVIQEVHIPLEKDILIAREYWTVLDGETMYVYVEGLKGWQENLQLAFVYNRGRKYWLNEQGAVESTSVSRDFIEPFFHFRTAKGIAALLIESRMAPRSVLAELPTPRDLGEPTYEPQNFVKLSRLNHLVAFVFGETVPDGTQLWPALWVGQDSFHVLRFRLASQAEVTAEDYHSFPGGLQLPKSRTVRWPDGSATIQLAKLGYLGRSSKAGKEKTQPSYLKDLATKRKLRARWPENHRAKEFYTRFR